MEDEPPGHEQVQRPARVARRRYGDQGDDDRVDQAAGIDQPVVDALEQNGLGIHEEVVREQRAQAEAEIFDRPAPVVRGVGEQVLDQQQDDQRQDQTAEKPELHACPVQGDTETGIAGDVDQGDRDGERGHACRYDQLEPRHAAVHPGGDQNRDEECNPTGASGDFQQRHQDIGAGGPEGDIGRRRRPRRRQHAGRDQPGAELAPAPTGQHQNRDGGVCHRRRRVSQDRHDARRSGQISAPRPGTAPPGRSGPAPEGRGTGCNS